MKTQEKSSCSTPHSQTFISPEVMGRFRRELAWTMGDARANGVLARTGLSCGQAAAMTNKEGSPSWENLGEIRLVSDTGATNIIYEVKDSQEAKEFLTYFHVAKMRCQCWFLAGYLTGLNSWIKGEPFFFLETQCLAKGDPVCRFIGQSRDAWSKEGHMDLSPYEESDMAMELLNANQQLHLTKDRYQNLFDQSNLPIFIIDPQSGALFNINRAAVDLTGYTRDQLLTMTLFDLCSPKEHNHVMADLKALMNGLELTDKEVSIQRQDGMVRIIAHTAKVLTYGGQIVVQSVMRDVTELKLSNQKEKDLQHQLIRSERLSSIGRLAASVAHELRNPLGAIRNAIYYIRNALTGTSLLETDPNLKMILKLAESEVDSSVIIIGELLDYSHIVQLVPRHTLLNEVLENLPNIVVVPNEVTLIWDLDLTLPSAIVDPDRLNQVFCNLMSNAIQAMPHGGTLKIKSGFIFETANQEESSEGYIVVVFEDTGNGIETVHLTKIFEPLFTTKARGTGLGLAISRNIVEKHGGQILVTSQIGKGTSFTVKLPLRVPIEKEEKI